MNSATVDTPPPARPPGRRLALVVGTNQTATLVPPPLRAAVADAEAMAEVLRQRCGVELFVPPLLGEQATSHLVKKAVLQLARERAPEDVLFFFFSGHGIQVYDDKQPGGRNTYLGTADFDMRDVEDDSSLHISLHWLRDRLFQHCEAGQVVMMLDCCYAEDVRTGSDHRLDSLLAQLAYYLEIPGAEVGKRQSGLRVALAATGYDQTAREDEEHGRMTSLILRGLRGEVLSLVNEEGGISLARLAEYLIKELSPEQKPAVFTSNATGQECILASYPDLVPLAYPPLARPDRPLTYIPFARDPFFQERAGEFAYLETLLRDAPSGNGAERSGFLGLTGPGGVGKTQLAVELAYRFLEQGRYAGGIFWTQPGGTDRASWEAQFALLAAEAQYLPPDDDPASPEHTARRARYLLRYLIDHPDALLILDNVVEPALLMTLLPALAGRDLRCAILYTSRTRSTPPGATTYAVKPLAEQAALRLLLPTTRSSLLAGKLDEAQQAELKAARNMCQRVGYLPLALVHLRSQLTRDRQITLADLDDVLRTQGMQGLLGAADTPTTTFALSWESVRTAEARRLFLLAACFPEATPVPLWLVGLAAGLGERDTILEPLGQARLHLQDVSLLEELSNQMVRLHPLVRDFALDVLRRSGQQGEDLLAEARQRLADVCTLAWLERQARDEGYWRLLERVRQMRVYSDLLVLDGKPSFANFLHALERWLDRESYLLAQERWWPETFPWLFYQQLFNRAVEMGYRLPPHVEGMPPPVWVRQVAPAQTDDRALLRLFAHHAGAVSGVAFSPDGQRVLTGSIDGTASVWERESGRELRGLRLPDSSSSITSVAFAPHDARLVLLGSGDGTARLWDWESGRELARLQGHTYRVRGVAFSPDGQFLLTGSNDGTARLWERESGRELVRFQGHTDWVTGVAFSPDGSYVATCSSDRTARVWAREGGRELACLRGHASHILGIAFSPDGEAILTASADQTARLWDWRGGRELHCLQGHTGEVWCVAFSAQGQLIATGSEDATVGLWERESGRALARLQGHTSIVRSVAFAPDGQQVLSGSGDRTARLWTWDYDAERDTAPRHAGRGTSVAFSPDGKYLLTGSTDSRVCLWQLANPGEPVRLEKQFQGHTGWINGVTFSPDGQQVLSGSGDGTARLWDRERAGQIARVRLPALTDWVLSVAFAPDGLQFLTGSSDGTAYLWDSYTGGELARLRGHADGVTCAAFAPDGKQILTGSHDRTARLWDRHTARELAVLRTGAYEVTSVAFAPDGRYLLTGSTDGSVRLWDRSTFSELACLRAHTSAVRSMAFAPRGQLVLTCDANGRVFFWRIASSLSATPIGLYIAHYEIAAIFWTDAHHPLLADAGGPGGRPHVYDLSLEGMS